MLLTILYTVSVHTTPASYDFTNKYFIVFYCKNTDRIVAKSFQYCSGKVFILYHRCEICFVVCSRISS